MPDVLPVLSPRAQSRLDNAVTSAQRRDKMMDSRYAARPVQLVERTVDRWFRTEMILREAKV